MLEWSRGRNIEPYTMARAFAISSAKPSSNDTHNFVAVRRQVKPIHVATLITLLL